VRRRDGQGHGNEPIGGKAGVGSRKGEGKKKENPKSIIDEAVDQRGHPPNQGK